MTEEQEEQQQEEEIIDLSEQQVANIQEAVEPQMEPQPEQQPIAESQAAAETEPVSEEPPPTIESVVEAVLFASDEPLSDDRLADIVGITPKQIRENVKILNDKYQQNNNAFRIEQIAGGFQMQTLPPYSLWLKKLIRVRSDNKLTPATLETLAIIAYKQPIIRADIESVRGVAVGDIVRNLMDKGLVRITGRAEVLGRPMLYGTTKKFLEIFGLNSLKDLPKVEELKKPQA
jgi:segregation and condensation protein B